jgi:hypothetical protein
MATNSFRLHQSNPNRVSTFTWYLGLLINQSSTNRLQFHTHHSTICSAFFFKKEKKKKSDLQQTCLSAETPCGSLQSRTAL